MTVRCGLALTACAALMTSACAARSRSSTDHSRQDVIVLLPDPDGDTVGRASVSSAGQTVDLAVARASTTVPRGGAPGRVTVLSEGEVRQRFGAALAALPPQPEYFILYFQFDSEELTEDSTILLDKVLRTVKERPSSDVVVRGHTDTRGTNASNFELGRRRANKVRRLLIDTGVSPALVEATSHGEAELLVHTADEVFEPRNRRVDVTVR